MSEASPFGDRQVDYPVPFTLKVFGSDDEAFESHVQAIVARHATLSPHSIHSRRSRNGRYRAVSCSFQAESRTQLDALYAELQADPHVLYTF
jgi:hypothetical protein